MKNYLSIVLILILITACNGKPTEKETETKINDVKLIELTASQLKNAGIKTGRLDQKAINLKLKVNGVIDVPPQNMISVSAPLGGYLKSTKLLEGMHISKDEVIATMEDHQYIELQQEYLTSKARLSQAEKEFQRQKELNQSKASSDKIFENAEAEYMSQKVLVKSFYEKLKLIGIQPENLTENSISRTVPIHSPINGYVSSVKMNIGKYTAPTDVLFELVNPEDIHLSLTVFEKDLNKLYLGQKIIAYSNQPDAKRYNCEIILIGQNISNDRAATVHCHFLQYDKTLIPGMYMNAEIEIPSDKAFAIPNDGLVQYEGKYYVFVQLSDAKFVMEEVLPLNSASDFTQIQFVHQKNPGDKMCVTKGAYTLLMTMMNSPE
ncbi:MAG: rane fusion protein cobalt-zinc-cadmium efflux system [Bacteroidota bacterium]|jgi:cobalt-zinc-cadmium efflux system membrane fusion protein|nr:rane fusion protein cobalt-zinc-cadmium efflux system [Bacteroidota bacterium]